MRKQEVLDMGGARACYAVNRIREPVGCPGEHVIQSEEVSALPVIRAHYVFVTKSEC